FGRGGAPVPECVVFLESSGAGAVVPRKGGRSGRTFSRSAAARRGECRCLAEPGRGAGGPGTAGPGDPLLSQGAGVAARGGRRRGGGRQGLVAAGKTAGGRPDLSGRSGHQPRDVEAWLGLGRVHLVRGEAPQAIEALSRALHLMPFRAAILSDLG